MFPWIVSISVLSSLISSQSFRYDEIFADIKICGTDKPAYPFCAAVDESPINIRRNKAQSGDNGYCDKNIEWFYRDQDQFEVEKKAHTIEVFASNAANFDNPVDVNLKKAVKKFCLEQVHFHWDISNNNLGSEHALNGKKYPLEVHFVHFNCERKSVSDVQSNYATQEQIDEARRRGIDTHELAVIAVWFDITDEANPAIDRILDGGRRIRQREVNECKVWNAPQPRCVFPDTAAGDRAAAIRDAILRVNQTGIDFTDILTDDILNGGYWTYEGSLTTPPCTDDLRWFMMKKRSYISEAQILRYRDIQRPCSDELMAPNWRPLQQNVDPVYQCGITNNDGYGNGNNCPPVPGYRYVDGYGYMQSEYIPNNYNKPNDYKNGEKGNNKKGNKKSKKNRY